MKHRLIVFVVVVAFLLGGCSRLINDVTASLENSDSKVGNELGMTIVKCFNEKDLETLKGLFSNNVKNTHNLENEINNAFEIIDKNIVLYDNFIIGSAESYQEGIKTYADISCTVPVMTNDKKYDICFFIYQPMIIQIWLD